MTAKTEKNERALRGEAASGDAPKRDNGATPAALNRIQLFEALSNQPSRALRIFDDRLNVVWDNAPKDRAKRFPVYVDRWGRLSDRPAAGDDSRGWPVQRTRDLGMPAENVYEAPPAFGGQGRRFRVRSWLFSPEGNGRSYIVEEIEPLTVEHALDNRIREFDREFADLIKTMGDYLAQREDLSDMNLRLSNPNFRVMCSPGDGCCPQGRKVGGDGPEQCWAEDRMGCEQGPEAENPLMRLHFCNQCEVFMVSCPDPLARVAENLNRLLSILQMKYRETLERERELQQAEKMAAIGELMVGLAHEIKTPLSVILSRLDCLNLELDSMSPEEMGEDLEVMRSHANRMRRVLDDVFSMARPRPLKLQPASINAIVDGSVAIIRKTMEKQGVELEVRKGRNLPEIHADAQEIRQVLLNLMLNARDAMPGGGSLTIETSCRRRASSGVEIRVSDNGQGIEPQNLERIFSPFYSTKTEKGGTGLGLVVCRRVMSYHGGTIDVESAPGQGTTFTLWFPCFERDRT